MVGLSRSEYVRLFLLVLIAGFFSGCASTQETSTIQQSLSMLHERQATMERRLESTEGKAHRGGEQYAKLEELQMRIGKLNGRIEELEYKLDQLQRNPPQAPMAAVPQQQPSHPSGTVVMEPPPAQPQAQPHIARPQPHATPPGPSPAQPPRVIQPGQPPSAPIAEMPDKAAYDRASQLFQQGKLEAARKEFQGFLSKYPKSEYADSALFNVGECYLSEKRYQDAIETYQQVIDKYPRGSKAPQALLKQGSAFQAIGDTTAARIIFERLVEKYPGTPTAQAAQKKLKQMP